MRIVPTWAGFGEESDDMMFQYTLDGTSTPKELQVADQIPLPREVRSIVEETLVPPYRYVSVIDADVGLVGFPKVSVNWTVN